MPYELRKQLEGASYPFKTKYACRICGYSPTNRASWCDLGCGSDYNEMRAIGNQPTLSELIEACGTQFRRLDYETFSQYKTGVPMWFAYERNEMRNFNESGSTPEEAVAKLWLALNQKPNG